MLLSLDTEFTCFHAPQLISIGLATQAGEEFYAELPVPVEACSEFTRHTVLPLLGRDPHAQCEDAYALRMRLLTWLAIVRRAEPLQICFDFETDWDLFAAAVGTPLPDYCVPRKLASREIIDLMLWDFWRRHPDLSEHHALHDARALLHAIRLQPPIAQE